MVTLSGIEFNLWTVFLVLFFLGPALRWSWGAGRSRRTADNRSTHPGEWRRLEAELDRRLEVIAALESRVAELENRVDFAERLLAAGGRGGGAAQGTAPPAEGANDRRTQAPAWPRP